MLSLPKGCDLWEESLRGVCMFAGRVVNQTKLAVDQIDAPEFLVKTLVTRFFLYFYNMFGIV